MSKINEERNRLLTIVNKGIKLIYPMNKGSKGMTGNILAAPTHNNLVMSKEVK